jgi:Amt family ammonium transporter
MYSSVDTIWVLLGAILVFFMQAGFAMVETGFTRAKNAGNIIMKNMMDFALGTIFFWVVGFGLMFGISKTGGTNSFIGAGDFFITGDYGSTFPSWAFVIFQTVFCATAATIVSGAMAERTKFKAYCIYSILISSIIYPISGHWIWGGGWLSQLGFQDFAGSTAVHMVGGVAALVGAKILGPRIDKYSADGKSKAIPGHSLTLGALGVFILWFCWFGFNGCSSISMTGDDVLINTSKIMVTTNMSAAVAAATTMIFTWIRYKKSDVSMTLNGALAGLVGITAGCNNVSVSGAAIIGLICGIVIVFSVEFFDNKLKIDDPVGAISVHGVCGALGTILVGFFSLDKGFFYGGGFHLLGIQIIGVIAVMAWVAITMGIVFSILNKTMGLRVSEAEEHAGLDIEEHGLSSAYSDFMPMNNTLKKVYEHVSVEIKESAPIVIKKPVNKLTKIVVVANPSKFDVLKKALNDIGVTGVTVTNVIGCGIQKGRVEYYRGTELDMNLLPKIKLEIVVSKVPVELAVNTIKSVLYSGSFGDGKIFIYDVENVIKVRTGETGFAALQNNE